MIKIFDIYQYTCNQNSSEDYSELQRYMAENRITMHENEIVISGRITDGVIGVSDRLFADGTDLTICVRNIYSYGHEHDYLSAGMTCAIKAEMPASCDWANARFLSKERKRSILAADFEYGAVSADESAHKEVDEPNVTAQVEKMVSFLEDNGDLFIQKLLDNGGLYHSLSLWKDKHNSVQTTYQILNGLQADSMSFWSEDGVITIMFSVPDNESCLFGHYVQTDFNMEWELISWSIC